MLKDKSLTLFVTDHTEKQLLQPIADEAKGRGWQIKFTSYVKEKAEIGIYCQHPSCYPENSNLSVIMLHGMDQGRKAWPNLWQKEPWNNFDIGILPGKEWGRRWQESSWDPYSRTRLGIYELGWPKADLIFKDKTEFDKKVHEFKRTLNLKHEHSILYALAFETDQKQDAFVQALKDLPVNLFLKTWLTEDDIKTYPDLYENQQQMNKLHEGIENVRIIDSRVSIMYCLGASDVFVTDESAILYESLLLDVPSVSISDWPMRTNNHSPPRFPDVDCKFTHKVNIADLKDTVVELIENASDHKKDLKSYRSECFSVLGNSSNAILDLLESIPDSYDTIAPLSAKYKIRKYIRITRPLNRLIKKNILVRIIRKLV